MDLYIEHLLHDGGRFERYARSPADPSSRPRTAGQFLRRWGNSRGRQGLRHVGRSVSSRRMTRSRRSVSGSSGLDSFAVGWNVQPPAALRSGTIAAHDLLTVTLDTPVWRALRPLECRSDPLPSDVHPCRSAG